MGVDAQEVKLAGKYSTCQVERLYNDLNLWLRPRFESVGKSDLASRKYRLAKSEAYTYNF